MKKVKLLIIEDGGFDSGLYPVQVDAYVMGQSAVEKKTLELYETFAERLTFALLQRRYTVEISFARKWSKTKQDELKKYNVVLCDCDFASTDTVPLDFLSKLVAQGNVQNIERILKLNWVPFDTEGAYQLMLQAMLTTIKKTPLSNDDESMIDWFTRELQYSGLVYVIRDMLAINKRITFFTSDLGHSAAAVLYALFSGAITYYDIKDVLSKGYIHQRQEKAQSGRFIVGGKHTFKGWVNAVEAAIKYQLNNKQ